MKHTFKPFDKVLWREDDHRVWQTGLYEKPFDNVGIKHYVAYREDPMFCVPYEGNEHLLGTRGNPEYVRQFKYGDKVEYTDSYMENWREALYLYGCADNGCHSLYDREDSIIVKVWSSSHIRHAKQEKNQ